MWWIWENYAWKTTAITKQETRLGEEDKGTDSVGPGIKPATQICTVDRESKLWSFSLQADVPTTEQHRPGQGLLVVLSDFTQACTMS